MNEPDLLDDDFMQEAQTTQRNIAILGFAFFLISLLFIAAIIYFFLAAAGIVPTLEVVPFIPYI